MPFKDIDLDNLMKQNKIENDVLKQITINNKMNTSTLEGFKDKLNAIELVTGKRHELPSYEERITHEESLLPITNQLKEIQEKLVLNHQEHQQQPLPQIEYRNVDRDFLKDVYTSVVGDDINLNNRRDFDVAIREIGNEKRRVDDKQSQRYNQLTELGDYLKGYRQAHYPAQSRLPRLTPTQISPRRRLITTTRITPRRRLPSAPPSLHIEEASDQEGDGLFTGFNEIFEKLKVLIGEISSGNKNKKLKNEASDIIEFLLRSQKINKSQYTNLMGLISNL